MVPKERLELPRVAPHGPQPCASTNSTTSAKSVCYWAGVSAGALWVAAGVSVITEALGLVPEW